MTYTEKRKAPRYPFIATAELVEEASDTRMSSRVSELALHGCYLDMMNPFPQNTRIIVRIYAGNEFFEASATVVYSQPNMGMGVKFLDVKPHYTQVLNGWLLKAMHGTAQA